LLAEINPQRPNRKSDFDNGRLASWGGLFDAVAFGFIISKMPSNFVSVVRSFFGPSKSTDA
jgi:hypothetical protein